jgi:hypothetical protein
MFDVRGQLTIALTANQRGFDFHERSEPHHGPRVRVVLRPSKIGGCFGYE